MLMRFEKYLYVYFSMYLYRILNDWILLFINNPNIKIIEIYMLNINKQNNHILWNSK